MGGMRDGYIEVNDRIAAFYAKHPEGTLKGEWDIKTVGETTFIVYRAEALRSPKDREPGVGHAWEPFPGKTPFTKDSELMNAETSAWGRAIAALGFEVREGIATKEDVQARSDVAGPPQNKKTGFASDKQRNLFAGKLKAAGAPPVVVEAICAYASAELHGHREGSISVAIAALKKGGDEAQAMLTRLQTATEKWQESNSDVPADTTGLGVAT